MLYKRKQEKMLVPTLDCLMLSMKCDRGRLMTQEKDDANKRWKATRRKKAHQSIILLMAPQRPVDLTDMSSAGMLTLIDGQLV